MLWIHQKERHNSMTVYYSTYHQVTYCTLSKWGETTTVGNNTEKEPGSILYNIVQWSFHNQPVVTRQSRGNVWQQGNKLRQVRTGRDPGHHPNRGHHPGGRHSRRQPLERSRPSCAQTTPAADISWGSWGKVQTVRKTEGMEPVQGINDTTWTANLLGTICLLLQYSKLFYCIALWC